MRVAETTIFVVFGSFRALKPLRVSCQTFVLFFGTLEWLVLSSEIERRKNKARRIIRLSISHYKTSASSARAERKNDRENVWLHTRNDFRAFTKDATPKTLQIQCSERPLAQNVLCLSSGMMRRLKKHGIRRA